MRRATMGTRRFGVLVALLVAAALAAGLLALVGTTKPAKAAFPGTNGKITFTHNLENFPTTNDDIYVMDADGLNQTQLTNNGPVPDDNPVFSPSGTKIAFDTNRDGNENIYRMDAADTNADGNGDHLTRLTKKTATDEEPAYSPNGRRIAFTSDRAGDRDIWVMKARPEGRKNRPHNLTKNPADDAEASFSPDGTKIVFRSGRVAGDFSEVFVMDAVDTDNDGEGDNMTNISNDPAANDAFPAFSPDGTKIVFRSNRTTGTGVDNPEGDYEIFVINANGTGGLTQLTKNDKPDARPDWGVAPA